MKVTEAMTSDVEVLNPDDRVAYAAARMRDLEVGFLPVAEDGRAVGVLTDRDIAIRCCGDGRDPRQTPVADIMTRAVISCSETAELAAATQLMETRKIRRLLVTNESGRIAGIVSVDDLAARMQDPGVFSRVLNTVALGTPHRSANEE